LVWGAILIVVVGLYFKRMGGVSVTGFSEEIRYNVAPEITGRLQRLEVRLNQKVTSGQIVASFEDGDLLLQLQEARTELHRLGFELDREKALYKFNAAGQQVDQQTNMRRFARDVENAHVDYLEALSSLAESRIELQGLELTLNRSRRLEEEGLTPTATFDNDRLSFQALSDRVTVEESRVEVLLTTYNETDARYSRFLKEYMAETPEADLILKPLKNAIRVQEIRVEQVNLSIIGRVLRSPVNGLVAGILRHPGEIVTTGQPVLFILEPVSSRVIAYIPEHRVLDFKPGSRVKISRVADTGSVFYSSISHLGASIEQLPPRYTPGTTIPAWGLSVYIPLPDSLMVRPGEAFHLFF
jgi:multidrug resistance efflux pump